MSRFLITGATGFVGRHLVKHLLSAGRCLTLAVRSVDACPASWLDHPAIKIVATGPIEMASNFEQAFADVDTVIHLAGLAHVASSPSAINSFERANVATTANLVQAAAHYNVRVFIHMSSLAAVTQNSSPTIINDVTSRTALTPFGRAKQSAEKHVLALIQKDVFAISLRPPLVVGAEAKGNWRTLQRLALTGLPLPFASVSNHRSLIGVDTLVKAILHLSTGRWSPDKSGNYCIADAESMSLPGIVTTLRAGMGLPPRLFAFPPMLFHAAARLIGRQQMAAGLLGNLQIDADRFRQVFDFSQQKSLKDSIVESGVNYRRLCGGERQEQTS